MRIIGANSNLGTGVGARGATEFEQCDGKQGNRHLFAGGKQYIEFARCRMRAYRACQADEPVGLAAHGRHHDHDVLARGTAALHALRNLDDAFDGTNRGSAVLLHD